MSGDSERRVLPAYGDAGKEDETDRTPAELLALVETERARTSAALEPDARLIYGAWGLAWLVGFAALYLARTGRGPIPVPGPVAGLALFALMAAAAAVTGAHIARRFAGVRGTSSRVGAMYGWAWLLAFLTGAAILAGARRAGAGEAVLSILSTAGSGLVVGLLYLAGGALWQDRVQYGLGLWILAVSAAGAMTGGPGIFLVMSLAGGGGFLLAAAYFALQPLGVPRRSDPAAP